MRIVKTTNSNFGNSNSHIKHGAVKNTELSHNDGDLDGDDTVVKNQLIATQTTDYKRFVGGRWRSFSPFIAQYIDQKNTKRSRAHIGRKPNHQAQKIYKNSVHAVKQNKDQKFDQSI